MMGVKDLIKTKTFWSGVGLLAYGLAVQDWQSVLTGLSVIFLRDAISKVKDRENGYGFP
jgi:hypothetical protein